MSSLLLNNNCNIRCPFCFAEESKPNEKKFAHNYSKKINKYLFTRPTVVLQRCDSMGEREEEMMRLQLLRPRIS